MRLLARFAPLLIAIEYLLIGIVLGVVISR